MEHKDCFALKSELGILKFLVSDIAYINKLKPFKTDSNIKKVKKSKGYQLINGIKKSPLLEGYLESENGYFFISPVGKGLSYFVDGDLDPVFRSEIVMDERSLAEAIVASPASVRKYVPATKISRIKNEATYSLFCQSSSNPNLAANLDIIDEFLSQETTEGSFLNDTENA